MQGGQATQQEGCLLSAGAIPSVVKVQDQSIT